MRAGSSSTSAANQASKAGALLPAPRGRRGLREEAPQGGPRTVGPEPGQEGRELAAVRPDEEGEPGLVGEVAQGVGAGVVRVEALGGPGRVVEEGGLAAGGAAVVGAGHGGRRNRTGR